MKVFISWSGERSHAIAQALHGWLPSIIQTLEAWISDEDTSKGARWAAKLANELETTQVGIICLTPENLTSSWLIFEAGALSKTQQDTYVCTFLYELTETDFQGPLAQFQNTKAMKEDIRKLVLDINKFQKDRAISEKQVSIAFERGWPELENLLENVSRIPAETKKKRPVEDMVEEILELIRTKAREDESFRYHSSARLPSTLNWSPEDADILLSLYTGMLTNQLSEEEWKHAEKIRIDEPTALDALAKIKAGLKIRKPHWGRILADYLEPDKRDS